MLKLKLTKRSLKFLDKLEKSDRKTAIRIWSKIKQLRNEEITGEPLQGASDYGKTRVGKYRIISTREDEETLLVYIIEKRETVYDTFEHLLNL